MKERTELRARAGPLVDERAAVLHEAVEINSLELSAERGPALEELFERGLNDRPDGQCVAGGDEMDRPAKERHADRRPLGDQGREVVRPEFVDPAPKSDVRVVWNLRLHSDELLDGIRG